MLPGNNIHSVHDWIHFIRENYQEIRLFQRNVYHLRIEAIYQFLNFLFGRDGTNQNLSD